VLVLVIMETVIVVLLTGLVAGLLRSHADILRALHSLGAGVGDPTAVASDDAARAATDHGGGSLLHIGPPLPVGRDSSSAHDLVGVDVRGDAVAVAVAHTNQLTLLAFLSSGCSTCAGFWTALGEPNGGGLPGDVRAVVVTKGPELEIPSDVERRAPVGTTVVMSSEAWDDYEVPGSPFFILIDGQTQRRVGEGVARQFSQVADLVRRARADARPASTKGPGFGLDGKTREAMNDNELMAAGIRPGHSSLYPTRLDDVFSAASDVPGVSRPAR
jgi:hypothetical protein